MIVSEDEVFTRRQAEEFGGFVRTVLSLKRQRNRRVIDDWSPLPPYQSRFRLLPLEGANALPWLIEPEPRLQVVLRIRRFDLYGSELVEHPLEEALRETKARIGEILRDHVLFNDRVVQGTTDSKDELVMSENKRDLELRFGVQLIEV